MAPLKQAKKAPMDRLPVHKRIALGARPTKPIASPSVGRAKGKAK